MILSVKRTHGTHGYTHGKLSIDGEYFCETMEDQERTTKVAGATAIPCGNYKVVVDMSTRFGRLMPHILNVPNFEGIRIHSGNYAGLETLLIKTSINTQKDVLYSDEYIEVCDD